MLKPSKLKTEYVENPIGIDSTQPRLSWQLESLQHVQFQTAYQVLVSSSKEALNAGTGEMWDSEKVSSEQSIHVPYKGKQLEFNKIYYWKIRVWDALDTASAWSETAYWSIGLGMEANWQGDWISSVKTENTHLQPCPYFRKLFQIKPNVRRAFVYSTALGVYMLYLNGKKVGEDWLAPGWTDYHSCVQYQTYDVTDLLLAGDNAVGLILGSGWYAGQVGMIGKHIYGDHPYFLIQLNVEYEDGTSDTIVTDHSWRTTTGPIQYSDAIYGEFYDNRLVLKGWNTAGYTDDSWAQVVVGNPKRGVLTAQIDPPVKVMEDLLPSSVKKSINGSYIFDMGQNMVGWVRFETKGINGQKITLDYAEMLNPDGTLYKENLREAVQRETYILNGNGREAFHPHFTFHGFRYVEITGLTEIPTFFTIVGKVLYSATLQTGKFATSNPKINQLQNNIIWGQKSNFLSVPTDCPQRDERLGWTGDAQIFARTASFNADVSRFFTKYMSDMIDAQTPEGAFPDVAPDGGWYEFKTTSERLQWKAPDNAGWGDAGVIIPWTVYQVYGDTSILQNSYEAMTKWIAYLEQKSDQLLRPDYANYGDWLSIDADTPKDVLATAYFAYDADLLSRIAGVLGKDQDQKKYQQLFIAIREAFQKAYIDKECKIKGETQTVYVLALWMNLVNDEQRSKVLEHLVADIRAKGTHLSTGFLGVGYLLPTLTSEGSNDLAYELLNQESFPSWLYSVKHGATTIWERWDGWTEENGFQTPSMNSFNHYSLGSVGEWMYSTITGINTDPKRPGYKHSIIHPQPGGGLTWAQGEFDSIYGTIRTEWKRTGSFFHLKLDIPANTTATVHLPGSDLQFDAALAPYLTISKTGSKETIVEVGSGSYSFQVKSN